MNDSNLKDLLKRDTSVPKAPRDELIQIHQKIENQSVNTFEFFSLKSLSLAFCLVLIMAGVNITFNHSPELGLGLTEAEQQELIEFMLEDAYLNNGESSYAWIETIN